MCILCDVKNPAISKRRRRFLRGAMKACQQFAVVLKSPESGWRVSMMVSEHDENADIWCQPPAGKPYQFSFGWVPEVWATRPVPTKLEVRDIARHMRRRYRAWAKRAEVERAEAGAVH